MKHNDFIKLLSTMTPEEMMEYIKQNGKPPKMATPAVIIEEDKNEKEK